MRTTNVNLDPSAVPSWLLAAMLGVTLAAEVLDDCGPGEPAPEPPISIGECRASCEDGIASWGREGCACRGTTDDGGER